MIDSATMIVGYGKVYRQGMADWNAIIDGLAKPTLDVAPALPYLAGAAAEASARSRKSAREQPQART